MANGLLASARSARARVVGSTADPFVPSKLAEAIGFQKRSHGASEGNGGRNVPPAPCRARSA